LREANTAFVIVLADRSDGRGGPATIPKVSMEREQIVFVGTSDLSGHFRGKSFPAADLPARLERGVGLAPTNMFISAFGSIQTTPFGTLGEVFLVPDPATRVAVPFDGGAAESFLLGNIRTLEGAPWAFCPRYVLRRALDRLHRETGLTLLAAFEQEFTYSGVAAHPAQPYGLDAYRRQGLFGETLLAALRQAGVIPDSFLAEFGPQQFEVTVAPALGLRAADDAVVTRELAQAVAFRMGHRVSFTPLPTPSGTSNAVSVPSYLRCTRCSTRSTSEPCCASSASHSAANLRHASRNGPVPASRRRSTACSCIARTCARPMPYAESTPARGWM